MPQAEPKNLPVSGAVPNRVVHQADALEWLERQPELAGHSLITSMPDFGEFPGWSLSDWQAWFVRAAELCFRVVPPEGVAIFYQRDAKYQGAWVDKSYLIQKAAEKAGQSLLWHKIVCRATPGSATFGKPSFSHLLCFSRAVRLDLAQSTPDVILRAGKTTWARGMGLDACAVACEFIRTRTLSTVVLDPFCGHGTALAVANSMGFDAVGVEKSRKRAELALSLRVCDGEIVVSPRIRPPRS